MTPKKACHACHKPCPGMPVFDADGLLTGKKTAMTPLAMSRMSRLLVINRLATLCFSEIGTFRTPLVMSFCHLLKSLVFFSVILQVVDLQRSYDWHQKTPIKTQNDIYDTTLYNNIGFSCHKFALLLHNMVRGSSQAPPPDLTMSFSSYMVDDD